jgi:hypothetical protein
MNTPKIENFLEKSDMNYLFCLLTKLEIQRVNQLPAHVKQKFIEKITVMAMEHVAENEVPDYAMAEEAAREMDDEGDFDLEMETIDDSKHFIEDIDPEDMDEAIEDDFDDDGDDD